MHYVKGFDRDQMMMTSWGALVSPTSTARLIDAFVDSLNLAEFDVKELGQKDAHPMILKACLNFIYMEAIMA